MFDPGIPITVTKDPLGFSYGQGLLGPVPEVRRLDDIRPSLMDPHCQGPEEVYCIAMDVAMEKDWEDLRERNLLYGAVTYQKGVLGREPVRSQGHIHAVSPSCGASTCEVYEIWEGKACVYMQEGSGDDPGNCWAVWGGPGDVILVPPGWVHATVNVSREETMSFGAWCVRDYGFEYENVRRHRGIAFFPLWQGEDLVWVKNPTYRGGTFLEKNARPYPEFGLTRGIPIYRQYEENRNLFRFVTHPQEFSQLWEGYQP